MSKLIRYKYCLCIKCNKSIKIANSQFSIKGRGKFCSKDCRYPLKQKIVCPICKKEKFLPPSIAVNAKYCSFSCKSKAYKISKKGENNPSWRGGITRLGHSIRTCDKYTALRKKVIIRDKGYCVECRSYKKLEVHHIKPLWKLIEEFLLLNKPFNPEDDFFYDETNLITLCHKCHVKKKV